MLTLAAIFTAQRKYGTSSEVSDSEKVTYEVYLANCRRLLADKTPEDYFNWDRNKQVDFTDNLIIQFVRNNLKEVEGFVDERGDIMMEELIDRLRADITDFGILKAAWDDPNVQEIQINDFKTIWVIVGGHAELYTDKSGAPFQFVSDIELHSTINRLIYNPNGNSPRMTVVNPLINTRTTVKGYRLSGVNSSAITPDMKVGYDFPCTSITIRKYSPSRLTFDDFVKFGTLTEKMADFLRFCGRANIRLACVGPTSSGKTTLLNAIVWEVPKDNRLLLVQNPTEIMVYERSDETGTNLRNAVHWEASEVDTRLKDDPTTPTMANFIAHALRNTPDVIIPGEVRTPEEFFQMNRALKTGHRVLTTFHATDGADAVERMATELATLGGSVTDYLSSITHSIDIVVSQKKLSDGKRHVMAIEELTGRVNEFGKAETRVLFRYTLTGNIEKDPETGRILNIEGYFEQVNPISESMVQKFFEAGISKAELTPFTTVNNNDNYHSQVSSSYTGKEIDAKAMDEILNQSPQYADSASEAVGNSEEASYEESETEYSSSEQEASYEGGEGSYEESSYEESDYQGEEGYDEGEIPSDYSPDGEELDLFGEEDN